MRDSGAILPGIVVAFWAYAGFENLTFIAGEFRNPQRDFLLAMIIAFLIYSILAVTLTVLIAALIPHDQVSSFSGLFQLAARIPPAWLTTGIIALFALIIVQMNVASWLWGMSRLAYSSAKMGYLPHWIAHLDKRGLPGRAVLILGSIGVVLTSIAVAFPTLLATAFTLASSVFLFIYLLCLASYIRLTRGLCKRLLYGAFFLLLCTTLVSVGLKALYPLAVFLLAFSASLLRARRQTMHQEVEEKKTMHRVRSTTAIQRRTTMSTSHDKPYDGCADFDFLIGCWNIHHRRLREVFKGSTTWDEFEGQAVDRYILGKMGSISEVTLQFAEGPLEGITIRLFHPESGQWSIYWINGRDGNMSTPMIGGFSQGIGKFYAHEQVGGRHILSRFLWTNITTNSCHWEQAFSEDGGTTWETNWVMDLARAEGTNLNK